jgi:(1->4)-alpha-D-glucan 1-alpha-D-glucosylmutase
VELGDFSLVDPDNRRPVDFEGRAEALDRLLDGSAGAQGPVLEGLLRSWEDGRAKLFVTHKALQIRNKLSELFKNGEYLPLPASGDRTEHVCAFARRLGDTWSLIAVPRFYTQLVRMDRLTLKPGGWKPGVWKPGVWGRGRLVLPEDSPQKWENVFTGRTVETLPGTRELLLATTFESLPVALLCQTGQPAA